MEFSATQEIIVNLKKVREKKNLTIPQIKAMVDASGAYVSKTTIRRVFADNSESDDSFNYETSLRPIAAALLVNDEVAEDELSRAKFETFEAIGRHKDEVIETLQRQLADVKAEHDNRCRECEGRMNFLMHQIELKDKRMERKDEIINKLLEKVL